jgi:hypothetical protein
VHIRVQLLLLVLVGKEMVVSLLGVLFLMLVLLVGNRPLLPVFMVIKLQLVMLQLMLLLMLWELRLPGLACAHALLHGLVGIHAAGGRGVGGAYASTCAGSRPVVVACAHGRIFLIGGGATCRTSAR